ncbi:MAG: TlpA family protein disulfide reductase [Planctomycetia bacterium]|nr:TlpA family protein disulfide reductase [Planctomycetia bacterium]
MRPAYLVIAAVITALVAGCGDGRPAHPAIGRRMGPLPVVAIGDPALPAPSLAGQVTLLNFWGTWCPPCRQELPGLVRIADRLAGEPAFQLVAVSCGSGGDETLDDLARETREFLAARQLAVSAWALSDPLAASLFASAYGLEAFPTTYLIGPDARVRRVWTGYRSSDEADIAAAIVTLLKEQ